MRKVLVPHYQALSFLLSVADYVAPCRNSDELPAIVSHWLQNLRRDPTYCDATVASKWREALVKFALLERGAIDVSQRVSAAAATAGLEISFASVPFQPPPKPAFTFVDLFAGIGGFRLALQHLGGKCVFSCERDRSAKQTYLSNFGVVPFGDVRQFTSAGVSDAELASLIPDHDILAAGFPCQPFSRAGVVARGHLGQQTGFACQSQGNLFFDIVRIAEVKRPEVIFLENADNLISHDGGNTFKLIKDTITERLRYDFKAEVLDSSTLVPQRRERCYVVCFKRRKNDFSFPELKGAPQPLSKIIESDVPDRYTISDRLWQGHRERTRRNVERGTGFTAFQADLGKPANTLVARYGKDGKECLVPQQGKNPRKLTPRECARLQGFPEEFRLPKYDYAAYRQFGNAVPMPVVLRIARRIVKELR